MHQFDRRPIAAAGLLAALLAGCSSDPVNTAQEEGPQDQLQAIWEGNVLSSDRDAICAEGGDARMQAFRSAVDPWLTGTPAERMPTEDDLTVFLADACPSTGVQTADPSAGVAPSP
jgi:hypothetical protein